MPDDDSSESAFDSNAAIVALLRDLAQTHKSVRAGWGYKRGANAVLQLDVPIESMMRADGTLAKIVNVGPKSEQVIREAVAASPTMSSSTVEHAVAPSETSADIAHAFG